jgi:hypothetical protein
LSLATHAAALAAVEALETMQPNDPLVR